MQSTQDNLDLAFGNIFVPKGNISALRAQSVLHNNHFQLFIVSFMYQSNSSLQRNHSPLYVTVIALFT